MSQMYGSDDPEGGGTHVSDLLSQQTHDTIQSCQFCCLRAAGKCTKVPLLGYMTKDRAILMRI